MSGSDDSGSLKRPLVFGGVLRSRAANAGLRVSALSAEAELYKCTSQLTRRQTSRQSVVQRRGFQHTPNSIFPSQKSAEPRERYEGQDSARGIDGIPRGTAKRKTDCPDKATDKEGPKTRSDTVFRDCP